jgi:hypothetical protein
MWSSRIYLHFLYSAILHFYSLNPYLVDYKITYVILIIYSHNWGGENKALTSAISCTLIVSNNYLAVYIYSLSLSLFSSYFQNSS